MKLKNEMTIIFFRKTKKKKKSIVINIYSDRKLWVYSAISKELKLKTHYHRNVPKLVLKVKKSKFRNQVKDIISLYLCKHFHLEKRSINFICHPIWRHKYKSFSVIKIEYQYRLILIHWNFNLRNAHWIRPYRFFGNQHNLFDYFL